MKREAKKILVAMSGGVDSSVAAQLLNQAGYEVTGVFLHFWKEGGLSSESISWQDVKAVGAKIGIPVIDLDFTKPFKEEVVDYFLSEYRSGRTPNPCVVCNRQVKLGRLLLYAKTQGYDAVATGHYVKVRRHFGQYKLYRAADDSKDQSYFLYTLKQEDLAKLIFPLGDYRKTEVRQLAKSWNLPVFAKPESQDVCFLSGSSQDFLKRSLHPLPGNIVDNESRQVLGQHQGLPLYTIGQRKGIELGGDGPYFVCGFDYQKNILFVTRKWQSKSLYRQELMAEKVNLVSGKWPHRVINCGATIRYGQAANKAKVYFDKSKQSARVIFREEQRAITPGQSVVFYHGRHLLGGGVISVL